MTKPRIAVVTVNWNGKKVLEDCIRSVQRLDPPVESMIVVDNGSVDGSAEIVLACGDRRVSLIRNERNLGAPAGRNQGMRAALEAGVDQIYTLDNDLTAAPDAVSRLVAVLERDPRIAMAGSLILYESKPNVIFSAGLRINWTQNLVVSLGRDEEDRGQFRDIWDVDYVGSGAMLVRCSYLREHGLFDETMIGYGYEDTEFGYRATRRSFRVVCCADSRVWHKPFTGIGSYSYRKKYLEARNAVRFIKKYGTVGNWAKYLFYVTLGFGYAAVVEGAKGNFAGVRGKMLGFYDGLRNHDGRAIEMLNDAPGRKR